MSYITTGERIGYERGKEEGKYEGRQEGEQTLILRLLRRRMGDLPPEVWERLYWILQPLMIYLIG